MTRGESIEAVEKMAWLLRKIAPMNEEIILDGEKAIEALRQEIWHDAVDDPPEEDGVYAICYKYRDGYYDKIAVTSVRFCRGHGANGWITMQKPIKWTSIPRLEGDSR